MRSLTNLEFINPEGVTIPIGIGGGYDMVGTIKTYNSSMSAYEFTYEGDIIPREGNYIFNSLGILVGTVKNLLSIPGFTNLMIQVTSLLAPVSTLTNNSKFYIIKHS